MEGQLSIFEARKKGTPPKVVNVASVPQRSPFRYPGGKTWLIPVVRRWLKQSKEYKQLVEPFAGGGIVSLTAAFESLADRILMIELDKEVAAVWEVIINGITSGWPMRFFLLTLLLNKQTTYLKKKIKAFKSKHSVPS